MRSMWICAGAALTGLVGCGADAVRDVATFEEMVEESAAMAERVAEMPIARATDMPTTGSATFEGLAAIGVYTERESALVGDLSVQVDFAGEEIRGRIDGVTGSVDGGPVQDWDGALVLSDGYAGLFSGGGVGPDGPFEIPAYGGFDADLSGDLTAGTDVIVVDGTLRGEFHVEEGRVAALSGNSGSDEMNVVLNGTDVGGVVTVVGERP